MAGGHKERAHALLGPSGAHRWMVCTPSARLEEQFPDTAGEAAAEGTLAHELAEIKLRHYFQTTDFGKQKYTRAVNKLKKDPLWANEMEEHTDFYLDYVKQVALSERTHPSVMIEQKLNLDSYIPDGFGTADCILIRGEVLHVMDFKYGKGVPVSAEHNPQMMLYALGAYEAYKILYRIHTIRMTIVQPRLDSISEWECTLPDLLAFGEEVKQKAMLAMEGKGEFSPGEDTCRFCRARKTCRARAEENVKLAGFVQQKPPLISNEEVGNYLRQGQDVAKWLSDLQEYALGECLAGKEVPGWKAVEGRSVRAWTDMDAAFAKLEAGGIPAALLWEKKPLTLAQVEKEVGKAEFSALVGDMVVKNPGKPTLVPETDERPAVTNKITAAEAFGGEQAC